MKDFRAVRLTRISPRQGNQPSVCKRFFRCSFPGERHFHRNPLSCLQRILSTPGNCSRGEVLERTRVSERGGVDGRPNANGSVLTIKIMETRPWIGRLDVCKHERIREASAKMKYGKKTQRLPQCTLCNVGRITQRSAHKKRLGVGRPLAPRTSGYAKLRNPVKCIISSGLAHSLCRVLITDSRHEFAV